MRSQNSTALELEIINKNDNNIVAGFSGHDFSILLWDFVILITRP